MSIPQKVIDDTNRILEKHGTWVAQGKGSGWEVYTLTATARGIVAHAVCEVSSFDRAVEIARWHNHWDWVHRVKVAQRRRGRKG